MGSKAAAAKRARSRSERRLVRYAIAGVALAIAAWVGWSAFQGLKAPVPEAVERTGSIGTRVGELAPDFTVPTLDGGTFNLEAQRGQPSIIFIMAYWCGTCIPEARALAQIHEEYGDAVSIIALDVDPSSSVEALEQFKAAVGDPDYVWGFDVGQEVVRNYEVPSLDTTLILDPEGYVIYRDAYPTGYSTLKDALSAYLPGS